MDKILMAVFCLLTIAEYASFYHIVFGKKIQFSGKRAIGFPGAVLALVLMCLCWQEWVMDFRRALLFITCALAMFSLFEVSFWENLKLFLLAFAALVLLEGIFDCARRVLIDSDTINAMRNGLPVTTKQDRKNHGLGLLNVRSAVEKYRGSYNCKVKEQRYIVDIFIWSEPV